jgi:hypothetical protein
VQWKCDYRNQILRWHPSSLNIKSEAVLRLTRSLRFFHYFVVSSFHVLLLRPYGDGNKRKPAFWSAFLHSLHVVCHLLTHRFRFGATSLQFRSHTKLHTLFVRDHLPYFSVNVSFAAAAVIPALHILPVDCRYYIIKRRFNRCIKLGAHVYPSRSGFLVLGRCTHAIETWRSRSNGWVGVVLCAGTSGKVDVVIERIIVIYCVAHVFCICLYLTWIAIQNAIISPQPLSLSPISF